MFTTITIFGAFLLAAQPARLSPELEPPRQITALGEPIDIQREGQGCPVFADFDGDGLADLLVGEAFSGRLRIYRNLGTSKEPRFGDYEWFRAGGEIARVPWARGGYKGFTPQLADLDGDGKTDVVSGSIDASSDWLNSLYWFRRIDGTQFATAVKLVGTDGNPIGLKGGAQPGCADLDGDGDIDIVIGTLDGSILLLNNEGTPTSPQFAAPVPVVAEGQPIKAPSQWAHPCVADWDGDGRLDLLVGALDGSVVLYRNQGKKSASKFEGARTLVSESPVKTQLDAQRPKGISGMQPAVCVADFNGDGRVDLLLGDGCGRFAGPPRQTPTERERAQEYQARLDELRREWANAVERYRRLTSLAPKLPAKNATAKSEIAALRASIEKYVGQISAAQQDVEYDWARYQMHGFVWVFIRRPSTSN
ncbi:MAG: FG-GAP repeat domain-containing protein [Planctomycetaceae bacterium]